MDKRGKKQAREVPEAVAYATIIRSPRPSKALPKYLVA